MIGIYKITSPSKKIYIGQSIDIKRRFNSYKSLDCKNQTRIYNSLKKYGYKKHKFEIITECEIDKLNELERYYQDLYSSINSSGLNCCLVSASDKKPQISIETKLKLSESKKGNKNPMFGTKGYWFGKKRIVTWTNPPMTEKQKKSISQFHTGRKMSDETKIKISISNKGKVVSEKTKEKLRGQVWTEERKNKMIQTKIKNGTYYNIFNNGKNLKGLPIGRERENI